LGQEASAVGGHPDVVRNGVLHAKDSLSSVTRRAIVLRSEFQARLTQAFKQGAEQGKDDKEEGSISYADSFPEVPWILGVLKWVGPDEHHVQCHAARPNVRYLDTGNHFAIRCRVGSQSCDISEP
jgi:hypothetical protein